MPNFILENTFTSIFIISFILISLIRFLFWKLKLEPKKSFLTFGYFLTSIFYSSFLFIFLTLAYLAFMFFKVDIEQSNKYIKLQTSEPRIISEKPTFYLNINQPNYIGDSIKINKLREKDTVNSIASFNRDGGITGDEFILFNYDNNQYWIEKSKTLSYYDYSYKKVSLEFSTTDINESTIFWLRAKTYAFKYKNYSGNKVKETVFNDSVIYINTNSYSRPTYLKIERKKVGNRFDFKIYQNKYKGSETTFITEVIKSKKITIYTPENYQTFAYYILNGKFYY